MNKMLLEKEKTIILQMWMDGNEDWTIISRKNPEKKKCSHSVVPTEVIIPGGKDIEKIHADLLAGGDFAAIASEVSDCPSKARGGSLGTFSRGQMVPEFETAAFSQKVGDIGDVIETQFGYHIIKVTEYKQAGVRSLSEVKDQLQDYLTGKSKKESVMAYIDELKAKANIENHTPDFDAADAMDAE